MPPVTSAVAPAVAPAAAPRFDYPPARRTADEDVLHGVHVADPYRWLEVESDETKAWFEAQDQRARRELAKDNVVAFSQDLIPALKPLRENPLSRLPQRRGKASFLRMEHSIVMTLDGVESIVFDPTKTPDEGHITRWTPSLDGKHMLLERVKNGLDRHKAVLVETKTARVLDRIDGLEGSEVTWTKGGFFYGFAPPDVPHAGRFGERTINFHAIGTEQSKDRVVVPATHDPNAPGGVNPVDVTKDGTRLVVQPVGGWVNPKYAVVDLTKPAWPVVELTVPRAIVKSAIVVDNAIYVLTRRDDGTGDVGRVTGTSATPQVVMTAPPELLSIDSLGAFAVVTRAAKRGEEKEGFIYRDFYDASWNKLSSLVTPRGMRDAFHVLDGAESQKFVVMREGLGVPAFRFEFDPRNGARKELEASKVKWPTSDFVIDTLEATSKDGTKIPITAVRRKGTPLDGRAALALYGYGGFQSSAEQIFYPGWMIWPDHPGLIFAQCHMRGGVEFGPAWHRDGAVKNRQKTIDDFHACLEALHAAKYGVPGRTVIQGWSHGGMMVTAAALQRPELQRAVIAMAPLEDMIRYVHFGRGGISEYGDPENEAEFKALMGFSPYQNVKSGVAYPAFFVTAPSADERVHPMHPRKIVAALQDASNRSNGGEVLLKVLWEAGHNGGAKDDSLTVMAEAWAFALSKMDAPPPR